MALRRIGHQPERTGGAELELRYLQLAVEAADHQAFFAPVKLERFAQLERQRNKGAWRFAFASSPGADECRQLAVAAYVPIGLDLRKQRLGRTSVLLGTVAIGLECLSQCSVERGELAWHLASTVHRRCRILGRS